MKKLIAVLFIVLVLTGCGSKKKEEKKEFTLDNTSWVGTLNDGVEFEDEKIKLYQNEKDHSDDYFVGSYKLYLGSEGMNQVEEYNISIDDIKDEIEKNDNYSEDNFIFVDIKYDYGMVSGEKIEMYASPIPWYGFVLEDGNTLYVTNINTGAKLKFTRK